MTQGHPVKRVRVPDEALSTNIHELLTDVRSDLGRYGWSVHVEQAGNNLSFEFHNPLSPVATGMHFDSDRPISQLREELTEHLKAEPEFARTRITRPPRRKRELIGGIRWAATSYGWSNKVFREVIDTLQHFHVLAADEAEWLTTVGPNVLPNDMEREWRRRVRSELRRRDAGRRDRPVKP